MMVIINLTQAEQPANQNETQQQQNVDDDNELEAIRFCFVLRCVMFLLNA